MKLTEPQREAMRKADWLCPEDQTAGGEWCGNIGMPSTLRSLVNLGLIRMNEHGLVWITTKGRQIAAAEIRPK